MEPAPAQKATADPTSARGSAHAAPEAQGHPIAGGWTVDEFDVEEYAKTHPEHPPVLHTKWMPVISTILLVGVIVGIKLALRLSSVKFNGYLETADIAVVITGLFFICGQMFSIVNTDYKEAEKLPMDIANSLEQTDDHLVIAIAKVIDKGHSMQEVRPALIRLTRHIIEQMRGGSAAAYAGCLTELKMIVDVTMAWDRKGAANTAPVVVAIDKVRRSVSRARVISRTTALPVGQGLFQFFVLAATVILFLTAFKTEAALVVVMITVCTVTWLFVRLIASMDDPFGDDANPSIINRFIGSISDVDLFPLTELLERMEAAQDAVTKAAALATAV